MILEFLPSFMIVKFLSNSRSISKSISITKKLITFYVATFDYRMILSTSEKYNNQCRNYIITSFQWARYIPQYSLPSIWKDEKDVPVTNGTTVMNIRRLQIGCTWKTLFIPFLTRNLMSVEGVELYIARGVEVQCNLGGGLGGSPISKYGSCKWVQCSFESRLR